MRPGSTTSRVVPTPKGRGEVQRTPIGMPHSDSEASDASDSHTRAGGTGRSTGQRWTIGALSKKDSSTGFSVCHDMAGSIAEATSGPAARSGRLQAVQEFVQRG